MSALIYSATRPRPLIPVSAGTLADWLSQQPVITQQWVRDLGFQARPHTWCAIPDSSGAIAQILVGVLDLPNLYALAHLPFALPEGEYALQTGTVALDTTQAALGYALGAYQFTRYRRAKRLPASLLLPESANSKQLHAELAACSLARDLINTPTEDLGPLELALAIKQIATAHGGHYKEWVGQELLTYNFPAIHAVGRASHREPRLIELTWGNVSHPAITLIGKGVCFDTGGLNIKIGDFMRSMKKDMGGAAIAIGLAQAVMTLGLPVYLRLLVPAVENAIAENAYRPGEVIKTRAGLSVEIDNTDAEGRVILGDAITYAGELQPEIMIDFATLTGAARVALGPDLPALFSNREDLPQQLLQCGRKCQDPLWQMPLWQPYRKMLDSTIADLANGSASRNAGAITAALYLERFVPHQQAWMHVDTYAWNDASTPGRPRGGEVQGLRAALAWLCERYQ